MAGSMSQADLVADLKASLFDSASVLADEGDATLQRLLAQALPDMQLKRPRTKLGTVALTAGVAAYAIAESDFAALKFDLWRDTEKMGKPWQPTWPGPLPGISAGWNGTAWELRFDPAPTQLQIDVLGATCRFYFFAAHVIGAAAEDTTINPQDRGLLLLRAQAEAMLAIAVRNVAKPVRLQDGLSGMPRNSTPAALHETLLRQFREWR